MQSFSPRILPVMLWELWRASRWEMLARYSIIAAFLTLIFSISQNFGQVHMEVIRGVVILLAGVGCVFSTTWLGDLDNQKAGFTFRLGYTRPISNLQMVLVPTVYSVANAMLGYLACALLVQLMLGQRLPLLGPSLIFGCLVSVSMTVVWSSTHTVEKLIALFAVVGLALGLLAVRHSLHSDETPILLAIGKPEFFDLAWYEYLGLFLLSSLSLAVTVYAVGQQRFGEGVRWSSLIVRAVNAIATQRWWISARESFEAAVGPRDFRSPVAAQLWFEWRRTVHLLLVSLLCCASVLAFIVLSALVNETWGGVHAVRMWFGAIAFIPFVYQFLATDPVVGLMHKQGSTRLSLFDATRPLRCDQMIAIKLLVVAGWSIFGFLLMVATACLHTTLAQQWPLWGKVLAIDWRSIHSLWWLAGLCTFVGLYCSTTAMSLIFVMAICKYQKIFSALVFLATASLGVWAWDDSHGQTLRWLWLAYGYVIPTFLILGMLVTLGKSITAGYLSKHYLLGVMCCWGVFVALVIMLLLKAVSLFPPIPVHPIAWLVGLAFLLTPLATAAAAPLALASFRHG